MVERRKNKRVVFYADADYGYNGRITDISVDGAFVDTMTPLPEKSLINIKFKLPKSKEIMLKAIVTNTMHGMGMGIKFINMKAEERKILLDFISSTT
jgi:PilZ domain